MKTCFFQKFVYVSKTKNQFWVTSVHGNMNRVIQVNFDLLTPEKLRSQTFWTYTVKPTDYHCATKKLIDCVNDPKYDISIFISKGYLMIFSTKM